MRSKHPDLYVAGDATGSFQILHISNQEGRVAGHNAAGGSPKRRVDYSLMMSVVFTDPQVVGVGLGEAAARAAGHEVKTSIIGLDNVPRALAARDARGLIKLVADAKTDRLLGGQIIQ